MKKRDKLIQVRLTEKEKLMLKALEENFGGIGRSDVVRRCIFDRYKKEFPPYLVKGGKQVELEPEPTPGQLCEQAGGKVVEVNGMEKCELKLSPNTATQIPLTMTEKIASYIDGTRKF